MIKNSAVPLYQQLVESVKEQIASGELQENDRLMTEQELSTAYGVSRITVRKAMEILSDEGIVVRRQGIGTFVASRKLNRIFDKNNVLSFTETCEMNGSKASAELVSLEQKKASVSIAVHLGIKEGEKIICIRRIRSCDGRKVVLEENNFSEKYSYLLGEDLSGSLYATLKKHGAVPAHARKTVGICFPTRTEQDALEVAEGQPLLLHKDTVLDAEGNVIHYTKQIINPEHYELTIVI